MNQLGILSTEKLRQFYQLIISYSIQRLKKVFMTKKLSVYPWEEYFPHSFCIDSVI